MDSATPIPRWWLVHDVVLGTLAGTAAGLIAGLFITARLVNLPFLIAVTVFGGVTLGVFTLIRAHRIRRTFLIPTVVVTWLIFVFSAVFIAGLVNAVSNLQ